MTSASCATTRRCCPLLVDGVVEIAPVDGERRVAAVDGGFLSVANNRVSILSEHAALSDEIDVDGRAGRARGGRGRRGDDGDAAGPACRGPDPGGREGFLTDASDPSRGVPLG